MILQPDGTIRFLTVVEHLQRKTMVYQDSESTIYLQRNKQQPFSLTKGEGKNIYIDLFALRFGQKEQLQRKTGTGWAPIQYGCPRSERDAILFLPVEEVIDDNTQHSCPYKACQYWSNPTGVKGRYAFNCILVRYRVMGLIDQKVGLTLEEVSRIYACTRERIRQIQDRALQRMRHHSRLNQIEPFRERIPDYRDYASASIIEMA
ncbi:DNA-directed RNA polymerase [Candidatus Vecturithrix granuli]|uniref:DNA-directed RNA polymerase n=1 Tax=Vecturithrix granuli TaxID=1499967 RepID=A0A081C1P8_VECG1|nr:DNA-directed RNA polymerase [Candidatus Vecturithrix granuli]